MSKPKVLKVPPSELRKIAEAAACRAHHGLQPIKIKLRSCMRCENIFESLGERYCRECGRPQGVAIMGREIL